MPIEHVVPEIAVVVGAAIVLVTVLFAGRERQWLAAPLTLVTLGAAAIFTLDVAINGAPLVTMHGTWALDDVTNAARLTILGATALVVLLSPEWFRSDPRHGEYYTVLLLSALGAMLMAGAADTMELVVGILLASVTGYTLAAYHRGSGASVEAGMKFFLVGGLANVVLLTGVVLLFGVTKATGYTEIASALSGDVSTPALVAAVAMIAVGVAFELGAIPAHAWMPDVAEGAPAPVAGFLTVVPKIGALVGLMRILSLVPEGEAGWRPLVAVLALLTMTLGNLAALWQTDVRRLLGWSSVSQSGYGLMAVVAIGRSDDAIPALVAFLVAYAVANLAAFGVVVELRGRTAIEDYYGLAHERPWLAAAMAVALLSLVGIPPLAGFVAKLELFTATIDAGYGWLAVAAVVNTVVSLFYYLRVIGPAYLQPAPGRVPVLGRWAASSVTVATVAVVALGLGAALVLEPLTSAVLLP
ncbi:MAG: NADH-quinone oxidoreductase subunit N [Nitriliruptorales bacterium]|nr:NADH-quinone oxidoreductase subunit N [Nitriliruptorales bacterium]